MRARFATRTHRRRSSDGAHSLLGRRCVLYVRDDKASA
jgi:hypothetical protein